MNRLFISKLQCLVSARRFLTSKIMFDIKTFIFLDSETTGLPFMENNKTKITELCLAAVQVDHLNLGAFPRVVNKLCFCFNPAKIILSQCTEITGLSNDILEHQSQFSSKTVNTIANFLEENRSPLCFVAHNGNKFDYPILKAEIHRVKGNLPDDILCIDSLEAFRYLENSTKNEQVQEVIIEEKLEVTKEKKDLKALPFEFNDNYDGILCQMADELEKSESPKKLSVEEIQKGNETTPKKSMIPKGFCPDINKSKGCQSSSQMSTGGRKLNFGNGRESYKLGDIYSRLICKEPLEQHKAEGDVNMLITCAATFGEEFVNFGNKHAKPFRDIPMMVPGKKIGS